MNMNTVHVGCPSPDFGKWKSFNFHIHNFRDLDVTEGTATDLPPFTCFGHQWKLKLYPGGTERASPRHVSLYLQHVAGGKITVDLVCYARNNIGETIEQMKRTCACFDPTTKRHGTNNFVRVSKIPSGALTLDVRIRDNGSSFDFIPNNPFTENMLKLFMDEDTSDVSFEVKGESLCGHRAVFKMCAPTLAELCKSRDKTKAVPITGIRTDIFRHLLRYIYGGKVPSSELEMHAREIIEGADKFGVINLKLEAEVIHAAKIELTADNVVETLLYADAKNLARLKESAMSFIHKNPVKVLSNASFKSIPTDQGILSELLSVVAMENKRMVKDLGVLVGKSVPYQSMSIADLRWELASKQLDVDGSRETLISRLEEHCSDNDDTTNGKKRKIAEI